jgi:putative endonuclease
LAALCASVYAEVMLDMNKTITKTQRGSIAENLALAHLQQAGLVLVARNYKTPGRGGGEVDLIMQEAVDAKGSGKVGLGNAEATLVFIEVRQRVNSAHGGAAASVGGVKQRRVIFAARHYLLKFKQTPPCRFDVVSVEGDLADAPRLEWIKGAFDAPSY